MSQTANITTELVKELRDATGISVMQCRKALEEARGDTGKALLILKKTSSDIALKKSDRETKDGAILVKEESGKAVLVTLNCETDFVSKNKDFTDLLKKLADLALEKGAKEMKAGAKTLINPVIQKTGENISLGTVYEISGDVLGSYVHNGKIGVVVSLEGGNTELAKDIAMHTAAMKPEYISLDEIDTKAREAMTEIFEKEIAGSNKPEEIKKKMLDGKLSTYFKEKTLLEQSFIKNPEETISGLISKAGARIREIQRSSI